MTKNIADNERAFRIISGGFIASMAFWGPASNVFLLGLIPLITGAIGTCPLYYALGFNSAEEHDPRLSRRNREHYHH